MCARYTIRRRLNELAEQWRARLGPGMDLFAARYNIAPSQPVPVIARDERGESVLRLMRWGLIPHWAKDPSMGSRLINARIESVRDKPAFRDAVKYRRCVIPADGFYEWTSGPQGQRRPYFIHLPDDGMLTFAGLWEHWQDAQGNELETCVILTTVANEVVRPLHGRMPVLVDPPSGAAWLHASSPDEALAALHAAKDAAKLVLHPVNPRVNRPTVDDPRCVEPFLRDSERQAGLF